MFYKLQSYAAKSPCNHAAPVDDRRCTYDLDREDNPLLRGATERETCKELLKIHNSDVVEARTYYNTTHTHTGAAVKATARAMLDNIAKDDAQRASPELK